MTQRRVLDRIVMPALLVAFMGAAVVATAGPGGGATADAGPVVVTANPTAGITDGQVVSIHAEAPPGAQIYEIRARLCRHNAAINNAIKFGFQGRMCPVAAIGAGQFDEGFTPAPGTTAVDLAFAVGMGAITWVNELGYVNELQCGPGSPCDLVVQLQIPNDTVYATFPLLIGEGQVPPPPPPEESAPPAAPAGAAAPDAAAARTDGSAPADGSKAKPAAEGKSGSSKTSDSSSGAATPEAVDSDAAADLVNVPSAVIIPPDSTRSWRVFSGGIAGLVGGALIVLIVVRARRRMRLGALS